MTDFADRKFNNANQKAQEVIFNDLDIQVEIDLKSVMEDGTCRIQVIKDHPLSTSRIGLMALIIETLFVSVEVSFHPESGWLNVDYHLSYTHVSGGSNGNRTSKRFEISSF